MAMKAQPMKAQPKTYTRSVPNYSDHWVNHLALILAVMNEMEADELAATLAFVNSKYTR